MAEVAGGTFSDFMEIFAVATFSQRKQCHYDS